MDTFMSKLSLHAQKTQNEKSALNSQNPPKTPKKLLTQKTQNEKGAFNSQKPPKTPITTHPLNPAYYHKRRLSPTGKKL